MGGNCSLLIDLEIGDFSSISQTQLLVDALHALTVLVGNAAHVTTEEDIEFLEGLVLGLREELPDEETTSKREDGEEDVGTVLHGVKHVLGCKTNDEVEHPVGGSDNGNTTRTHTGGENFLSKDPCDGTPGVRKVNSEEPDEDNGNPSLSDGEMLALVPLGLVDTLNGSDNDVADEHANGTDNQESLTTELVQEEDGRKSEGDLQDTSDTGSEEISGSGRETERLEDLRSVVQNSVDTSELLENHHTTSQEDTLDHVGSEEGLPRCKDTTAANQLGLGLFVEHNGSLDFQELGSEKRVLGVEAAESAECGTSFIFTVLQHQPTRGEGEEEQSEEHCTEILEFTSCAKKSVKIDSQTHAGINCKAKGTRQETVF